MAKTINNKSSIFRLSAALVVLAAISGVCISTVRAQVWTEPVSAPPNNNANPPIWNQSTSAQPTSNFWISGNGRMGALILPGSTSGTITVDAPSAVTSYTMMFPATAGTNGQVLTTNGSGTTSWTTIAAGSQTPWTSNINGGGYTLTNVASLNTTGAITQNGVAVCLSNGTNCLASGTMGGSGTANYVPKFTAATTLGNSSIYDNGSVGIGTTSPVNGRLDVETTAASAAIYASASNSVNGVGVSGSGYTGVIGTGAYNGVSGSGTYAGVSGSNGTAGGYGVYGRNWVSSGTAYGVFGTVTSGTGTGVRGSGGLYGVYGDANGNNGYGVYGIATATSGTGTTYGVYGANNSTAGTAYGVYGTNSRGYGIYTPNSSFVGSYLVVGSASFTPAAGDIVAARDANTGVIYLGASGGRYLYFDGTSYNLNGGALITGTGPAGYYQDTQNGAYRATATTSDRGYFFQSYNGAATTMYVGLNGSYSGRVGINTTAPGASLEVQSATTNAAIRAVYSGSLSTQAAISASTTGSAGRAISAYTYGSYPGVEATSSGGVGVMASGSTYGFYTANSSYIGNELVFGSANPYIRTGGTYFIAPGGAYFNSGIVYFEAQAQFRGGIHNDAASSLTIAGGSTGHVYMPGQLKVGSNPAGLANGDISVSRDGSSGVIYLGNASHYLYYYSYDNSYHMPNANLLITAGYGFGTESDRRLKKDIVSLTDKQGLNIVNKLNPVTYNIKDPNVKTGRQYGFIAQEVQALLPELVIHQENGMLSLEYDGFISPIVKAIQEQQAEIKDLQNQIDELKAKAK